MLTTSPDSLIINPYTLYGEANKLELLYKRNDSLTRHSVPGLFTYFGSGPNNNSSTFLHSEFPKYNIWTTPMFYLGTGTNRRRDMDNSEYSSSFSESNNSDLSSPSSNDEMSLSPPSSNDDMLLSTPSSNEEMLSTPSSTDETNCDLFDDYDTRLPSMELIVPHKRLDLSPSCFLNGCVCGHHFEFRDMAYESRKRRNIKSSGVTIRPKTPPIKAKLRQVI